MNFIQDQEGHKPGNRRDLLRDAFFVHEANLLLKPIFFHFEINISFVIAEEEFQKIFYYSGIELIVQKPENFFAFSFSLFFLEYRTRDLLRGHAEDT